MFFYPSLLDFPSLLNVNFTRKIVTEHLLVGWQAPSMYREALGSQGRQLEHKDDGSCHRALGARATSPMKLTPI